MRTGEFLTKATVWTSIASYTIGCVSFAIRRSKSDSLTRLAWTFACASLFIHYIFAFQFYHSWSHTSAYLDTARQTNEVFSINWGGGVFVNYALMLLWIVDVSWWWLGGLDSYRQRSWMLVITWHAFLIFIIFNATVVFGSGIERWVGVVICLALCLSWILTAIKKR
jgi:hypothetical protein